LPSSLQMTTSPDYLVRQGRQPREIIRKIYVTSLMFAGERGGGGIGVMRIVAGSTRLYGHSRSLNSFTPSPHRQETVKCVSSVTKHFAKCFDAPDPPKCYCTLILNYWAIALGSRDTVWEPCKEHAELHRYRCSFPSVSRWSKQYGSLSISQFYRPPRPVTAIILLFIPYFYQVISCHH
jgi:hypothetical protein